MIAKKLCCDSLVRKQSQVDSAKICGTIDHGGLVYVKHFEEGKSNSFAQITLTKQKCSNTQNNYHFFFGICAQSGYGDEMMSQSIV